MLIQGETNSRLSELKKYKPTTVFEEKYWGNGDWENNGVDYIESTEQEIIYYIDGIKYIDTIENEVTIQTIQIYQPTDVEENDVFLLKFVDYGDMVTEPKTKDDVFVNRHQISPLKDNFLINDLTTIKEIQTFVGGNYFNIFKN